MKDRFKFRAYDPMSKIMHPDFTISEIAKILSNPVYNGIGAMKMYYAIDSLIWIQCTGLRDKDGTLIFEGDICELEVTVNREDYYMHEIRTGEIKIYSSGVTLKVYKVFDKERNQFCPVFAKYTHVAGYRAKVIGNIHQHKHLLK